MKSGFTSVILKQLAAFVDIDIKIVHPCAYVSPVLLFAFMFPITYFALDIGSFTNSLVNSASLCAKVLKY